MGLVRIPSGVVVMGLKNSLAHISTINNNSILIIPKPSPIWESKRLTARVANGIIINNLPFSEISDLVHLGNILLLCTKQVNETDHTLSSQK